MKKNDYIKKIIILLITLIITVLIFLLITIYNYSFASIKGNNIYAEDNRIEISLDNSEGSDPFLVNDFLPGDVIQKEYIIDAYYKGSVPLSFMIDNYSEKDRYGIERELEDSYLYDVCFITVKANDSLLIDNMKLSDVLDETYVYELNSSSKTHETIDYFITVSVPSSVHDNYSVLDETEYQEDSFKFDFKWWVDGSYTDEQGHLIPITGITGLYRKVISFDYLWIIILLLLIVFLFYIKRKLGKKYEEDK